MCNLKKNLILIKFEGKIIYNKVANTIIMPYVELDKGYKIHYLEKGKGKNLESWSIHTAKSQRSIAIEWEGSGKLGMGTKKRFFP